MCPGRICPLRSNSEAEMRPVFYRFTRKSVAHAPKKAPKQATKANKFGPGSRAGAAFGE
ncbi:MAG: hypothetical protein K0R82_2188 [Flavipsychrobacter sp.]|jgi:hypothetical protein|nr:hypothetical protein [Flavipsychrobacter sp.]